MLLLLLLDSLKFSKNILFFLFFEGYLAIEVIRVSQNVVMLSLWDMASYFWKNYESNFCSTHVFTITSNRWGDMQTMQGVAS